MIVAHPVEGVDAFIKVPQGWPMSDSPLKLTSIKSSNHYTEGISSSFVSKVKVGFTVPLLFVSLTSRWFFSYL